MEKIEAIAHVQSFSVMAIACILCVATIATGFGFALLGGKYIESSARQPEMMNPLQGKFFIIAGLLDAVAMISVVAAFIILFMNPMLGVFANL